MRDLTEKLDALAKPDFELKWQDVITEGGSIVQGGKTEYNTQLFLPVTVINHGAPSVITGVGLTVKLKDGTILAGAPMLPSKRDLVFHVPGGPLKFATSGSLLARGTANPIPTGGQVDGFVFYLFPPGIQSQLEDPATIITLAVSDVANKKYEGRILMFGRRRDRMMSSAGVLPK